MCHGVPAHLTSCSSGGEGRMMVEPERPAAGSLAPVGRTSPARELDRDIIPKNAAQHSRSSWKTGIIIPKNAAQQSRSRWKTGMIIPKNAAQQSRSRLEDRDIIPNNAAQHSMSSFPWQSLEPVHVIVWQMLESVYTEWVWLSYKHQIYFQLCFRAMHWRLQHTTAENCDEALYVHAVFHLPRRLP